ncbi:hypothetical protein GCM10009844_08170 [Nocardioides koreensis]|uniref:Uncharacterized protein n=1 Tax=Nocardioides koreensis TaxID=433651 RepID=A0ABP5KYW4_9ACTN
MYDHPWLGDPGYPVEAPGLDRLTHLVLVDGRLVDTWSEPVTGTRWQVHADRFDRELARPEPSPPPPPPWQRVLDWLASVCGGAGAVAALTVEPLTDDGCDLPTETPDAASRSRLEATAELLDAVAARCFDPEMATAFRRALLRLWAEEPEVVRHARTAAHLAGGICWAVGKANGSYRPQGDVRMGRVQEALALSSAISGYGSTVRRALVGFRDLDNPRWWRPEGIPNLEPLGRPELLSSPTRERLVRLRGRAVAAREAADDAA